MTKWAKLSEVKRGTLLEADSGFVCLRPGQLCPVKADACGALYVECEAGEHYLAGQAGIDGQTLVGFSIREDVK